MATQQRPLSPHLQVYKPQLTTAMSILHRITGVVNALGFLLVAFWLFALAAGEASYNAVLACLASLPGQLLLFAFAASLVYHLLNGIRHLAWDAGWGLEIPQVYRSGYAVIAVAVVLTGLLWFLGLSIGDAP
ncbi:succinate dehydrogenase, cytochrome b556 subunit [Silanimonas sp.]|uniref:succinate dehydrogenase, cytochrome b556 subunit n=1 Tax=Silanimonas sp. TaxID=1929290 RepID=UPI001BBB2419|nr:succinate dehydrogenase, cytochrome b556 subunit [Silanimonas sp.]MBS3896605.1 succinate dehydrogenase, cytochrome b556 subunit [Silanimonas sp.]MBS3923914.1 succinate dehydrogenase, cytochrome b556 subunit [Xanthomonadaceae bacterium]